MLGKIKSSKSVRILLTTVITIIGTVIVLFIVNYVALDNFAENDANVQNSIRRITEFSTERDYPTANELSEMVNNADFIFVGEYTGLNSTWNMARNPENIDAEDNDYYVEGHLYDFAIGEILKGYSDEDVILVNHKYSEQIKLTESNAIVNEQGIIVSEATETEDVTFTYVDNLYIEPEIGAKYMLFLLKDINFGNYYGAIEPFIVKIVGDTVFVQSNLLNGNETASQEINIDGTSRIINVSHRSVQISDNLSGKDYSAVKAEIIE
jgi:hypothetical protein